MTSPLLPDRDAEAGPHHDARRTLEGALWECKRVVVGQDAMLERVLVALLAGGHVLLEGVPGLAKTLTVRTLAEVLGGSFSRVQFTPDLVPADLVGTRIWHPDTRRVPHRARPGLRATCCSPTRSTAPPPRCSPRCSR